MVWGNPDGRKAMARKGRSFYFSDAKTTARWYFVIAMGRKAGHLALGIGKSAGATLTLILEEFAGHRVGLKMVVDTLAGAIIKRLTAGRRHGVAVLAEGLILGIDPEDPSRMRVRSVHSMSRARCLSAVSVQARYLRLLTRKS
jgi:6-phosphofructokinase